ncbi:hypothetical protein C6A88_31780 [Mycolicibacterium austroafricanum]|nr:hypothetical protein C6A88_31780 [Mycolicibacterium austroafricanum]
MLGVADFQIVAPSTSGQVLDRFTDRCGVCPWPRSTSTRFDVRLAIDWSLLERAVVDQLDRRIMHVIGCCGTQVLQTSRRSSDLARHLRVESDQCQGQPTYHRSVRLSLRLTRIELSGEHHPGMPRGHREILADNKSVRFGLTNRQQCTSLGRL